MSRGLYVMTWRHTQYIVAALEQCDIKLTWTPTGTPTQRVYDITSIHTYTHKHGRHRILGRLSACANCVYQVLFLPLLRAWERGYLNYPNPWLFDILILQEGRQDSSSGTVESALYQIVVFPLSEHCTTGLDKWRCTVTTGTMNLKCLQAALQVTCVTFDLYWQVFGTICQEHILANCVLLLLSMFLVTHCCYMNMC